jgi:homoserine O-succinyltransferase
MPRCRTTSRQRSLLAGDVSSTSDVTGADRPSHHGSIADDAGGARDPIVIGVVNNMPDSALATTERQFRDLLAAVAESCAIRVRFFSIPEVSRGAAGRAYVSEHCEDIQALRPGDVDGLIVTGTEPRAPTPADELYWHALTALVDWADEHTTSTIWSCLAAHTAVYYTDGIQRVPFGHKLSGVFDCVRASDHELTAGMPAHWPVPHSRQNTVPAEALIANGYQILSTSRDAGVDMFARQRGSLFVFVQGHPEYDPGALFREYQRDIGRFLAGKRDTYPEMPRGYFDEVAAGAFAEFRDKAFRSRHRDLLAEFPPESSVKISHVWRDAALGIYTNWVSRLAHRRSAPTR